MRRPGYKEAVRWLAENDDNGWLDDEYSRHHGEPPPISVTAGLVISLFGIQEERLIADLRRIIAEAETA